MNLLTRWLWRLVPGNPMLVRLVHAGSASRRHAMVRMGYLGGMILLVLLGLLGAGGLGEPVGLNELAKSGTRMFNLIAHAQVILICLLAPLFMAGAITTEQSGQTLDILLATPLSNAQIVLGSLLGRLYFVWALLLSGLPLFSVLLIFGGVPVSAVFVAVGVAALAALVTGSVAVTLAVTRLDGRKAVLLFMVAAAGYLVGAYAVDHLLLRHLVAEGRTTWLTPLHPLLVLEASFGRADYRPPTAEMLWGVPAWRAFYMSQPMAVFTLLSLAISGGLLAWSTLLVRRLGDAGMAGLPVLRLLWRRQAWGWRRSREVWMNPVAWREACARGGTIAGGVARWGFVAAMLIVMAIWLMMYHQGRLPRVMDGQVPLPAHVVFRYGLVGLLGVQVAVLTLTAVYLSAASVSREREEGTLDLLLTTPMTARTYIWGKLRGLAQLLALLAATPVLTMAMVSAYALVGQWLDWPGARVSHAVPGGSIVGGLMFPEAPLLLGVALVPFVGWCVWAGMAQSVRHRTVMGAMLATMAIVSAAMLALGLIGWLTAGRVPLAGVMFASLCPVTLLRVVVSPMSHVHGFAQQNPPYTMARLMMAVGVIAGGLIYLGVTGPAMRGLTARFHQSVRDLSGLR